MMPDLWGKWERAEQHPGLGKGGCTVPCFGHGELLWVPREEGCSHPVKQVMGIEDSVGADQ